MPTQVLLPKVDNDATEGRISRWFVQEDAAVSKGDLLFEIETEKAAVEVEAPAAGTIAGIVAPQGGSVPVGSPVALIWEEGETRRSVPSVLPVEISAATTSTSASSSETQKLASETGPESVIVRDESPVARLVPATPLARRLASERGIDLKLLRGTGPRGRIQSTDVPDVAPNARPYAPPLGDGAAILNCEWLRTGGDEPIVLVHGFGSELAIWRPLINGFTIKKPVLAVDLPAHGKSRGFEVNGFDAIVDLLEETLRAAGVRHAHLVGHSLGAATVTALAERSAFETRSLVLLSPAGLGPDINGAFLSGFCRARSERSLAAWMRLLVADSVYMSPALVRAVLRAQSEPGLAEKLERLSEKLFPDGTQAFSIRDALRGMSIPVKIIVGTEDRIIPVAHTRGLPGHVAIHCFNGVGHMPHLEIRSQVERLLIEAVHAARDA